MNACAGCAAHRADKRVMRESQRAAIVRLRRQIKDLELRLRSSYAQIAKLKAQRAPWLT